MLRDQIEKARRSYSNLKIVLGCEVKVLNTEGELDAPYDILATSDIVFIAFHSVNFETKEKFLEALKNALRNPFTDVWAHPGLYYLRRGFILTQEEIYHIVECCKNNQVLIEVNKKYNLPEEKLLFAARVQGVKFIQGLDAHSVRELEIGIRA